MPTIYVSDKTAPQLKIPDVCNQTIKFNQCKFETDDKEIIEYLDNLIETRPNIRQLVRKVDRKAAEKLALEHQAKQQAAKGPYNTDHAHLANREELMARDKELAMAAKDPEAAAKMSEQIRKDDLQLTENSAGEVHRDSGEGFNPVPEAEAAETVETPDANTNVPEAQKPSEDNTKTVKLLLGKKS